MTIEIKNQKRYSSVENIIKQDCQYFDLLTESCDLWGSSNAWNVQIALKMNT